MNTAVATQLKILRLSDLKPNFSEVARLYDINRRTVKNIMTDILANLNIMTNQVSLINMKNLLNKSLQLKVQP